MPEAQSRGDKSDMGDKSSYSRDLINNQRKKSGYGSASTWTKTLRDGNLQNLQNSGSGTPAFKFPQNSAPQVSESAYSSSFCPPTVHFIRRDSFRVRVFEHHLSRQRKRNLTRSVSAKKKPGWQRRCWYGVDRIVKLAHGHMRKAGLRDLQWGLPQVR